MHGAKVYLNTLDDGCFPERTLKNTLQLIEAGALIKELGEVHRGADYVDITIIGRGGSTRC